MELFINKVAGLNPKFCQCSYFQKIILVTSFEKVLLLFVIYYLSPENRTLTLQKILFYLLQLKPCKNDEKCFLCQLKSSFRSIFKFLL